VPADSFPAIHFGKFCSVPLISRCILAVVLALFTAHSLLEAQPPAIHNADWMPKIQPDREVALEGISPDWVKSLILCELRIESATPDREASLQVVKRFVDEAHVRNIRVLFDIVVWGTLPHAPLVTEHPEFYLRKKGEFVPVWSGYALDWSNLEMRRWFQSAAVELIEKTGADGFRVDLAPDTSGYFFQEVRDALLAKGRKIVIVSEMNSERKATFDFEQVGVHARTEVVRSQSGHFRLGMEPIARIQNYRSDDGT